MNELIAFILTGGAVAGGIVWVVKILIAKSIDAGVKTYQLRLDKELESHRHQLELMKIQYSSLNDKRGVFIAELYSMFFELETALQSVTTIFQGGEWSSIGEKDKQLMEQLHLVNAYFEKNRILISDNLCAFIENNIKEVESIFEKIIFAKSASSWEFVDDLPIVPVKKTPTEIWQEMDLLARNKIKENRKELAEQFRVLIGVSITANKKA